MSIVRENKDLRAISSILAYEKRQLMILGIKYYLAKYPSPVLQITAIIHSKALSEQKV